jgi:tetratricopeptide (TPR) repeat protein
MLLAIACWARAPVKAVDTPSPPAAVRFQQAYEALLSADKARDESRWTEAATQYASVRDMYLKLSEEYPEWQVGVVKFRIAYCLNQIDAIRRKKGGEGPAGILAGPGPVTGPGTKATRPRLAKLKVKAKRLIEEGETEEAREILLEAMRMDPDDKTVRMLSAAVQCQAGKYGDAVFVLTELIKEYPEDATAYITLGTAYFGQGKYEDAAKEINKALEIDPSSSEAHFNLVQIFLRLKPPDLDAAKEHYRKCIELGGKPDEKLEQILK